MKLKVTRKSHTRREGGKTITRYPGETFEGSKGELRLFGDRLEAVNDAAPADDEPEKGATDPDVKAALDANADAAVEMLEDMSDDQLREFAEHETRKGVQKAISDEQASRAE